MKQDRHPIDFDTAGSGEMAVLALVLGLEGPLLTTIMLKQGASLVMALGVLLLPVAIILPLVWVLWRPWPSRWLFEPLQEDAEVRTMQSLVGFNHCVRLATDRYGCTPPSTVLPLAAGGALLHSLVRDLVGRTRAFGKFTDTRKATVDGDR